VRIYWKKCPMTQLPGPVLVYTHTRIWCVQQYDRHEAMSFSVHDSFHLNKTHTDHIHTHTPHVLWCVGCNTHTTQHTPTHVQSANALVGLAKKKESEQEKASDMLDANRRGVAWQTERKQSRI